MTVRLDLASRERVRRPRRSVTTMQAHDLLALVIVLLAVIPVLYLVWRAAEGGERTLTTLMHPRTGQLLLRSVGLAAAVAGTSVVVALPLAFLTERVAVPGRRWIGVLVALPLAVPSYLTAYAVVAAFGPRGALASLLDRWVGSFRLPEVYGFFGAWLTLTLVTYPYSYLAVRAALRGLDPAFEEVARTLGTGRWIRFWRVTVPLLGPAVMSGMLLAALYTLSDFGAIAILRYPTLTYSVYNQYRLSFDRSAAAGLALLLVSVAVMLALAAREWQRRVAFYRTVGVRRPQAALRLRWWGWLLVLASSVFPTLALGLPVGMALYWFARARAIGEVLPSVGEPLVNTLWVGLLAGAVTVAAAFPVSRSVVRGRRRLATMLDVPLWIAYGLPGIVLALALVSVSVRFAPWLYQTIPLLIFGYTLRFLSEAVGTLRGTLVQQNPRLEEAARTLGMRPWQVWVKVQLPLTVPGLVNAYAAVFLTTVKELPVTLLLSPIDFRTLSTTVWNATADAFWSHAALPALLLLGVGVAPMGLLGWWQERAEGRSGIQ